MSVADAFITTVLSRATLLLAQLFERYKALNLKEVYKFNRLISWLDQLSSRDNDKQDIGRSRINQ